MVVAGPFDALLTPEAVRERCNEIFACAEAGRALHFDYDATGLDDAADRVVAEIRRNYPDGAVPFHSRWRHFELGGRDLWADTRARAGALSKEDEARARIDLAVVSVLLDAGAGPDWVFRDAATGLALGRSEGLALASLRMFEAGMFSDRGKDDPLRADRVALERLSMLCFADAFQVRPDNPLLGADKRVRLLNNLGAAIGGAQDVFCCDGACRPGYLFDYLKDKTTDGTIPARRILTAILEHLGDIWPAARRVGGVTMGDIGYHPQVTHKDGTDRIVPFHKLSQWMAYSLIEPIEAGGIRVVEPDGLTGLAEYRNGGLFLDAGALRLKNPADRERTHTPTDELIVEWRALTVALLDLIAARVREKMGADRNALPLAAVLQGGTWTAGRRIAKERRPDGGPPLKIAADGTLF